ncbi:MAG: hypothetical protein ACHQ15_02875 [Candidatus Limnocylindrales bacterium]
MALLRSFARPETAPVPEVGRLRRCTFRRLIAVRGGTRPVYSAECLYPDRTVAIPLGDLEAARPICANCAASHIFRPDED